MWIYRNLHFQVQKEVECSAIIRASEIVKRKEELTTNLGNKIKFRLMFDDKD